MIILMGEVPCVGVADASGAVDPSTLIRQILIRHAGGMSVGEPARGCVGESGQRCVGWFKHHHGVLIVDFPAVFAGDNPRLHKPTARGGVGRWWSVHGFFRVERGAEGDDFT